MLTFILSFGVFIPLISFLRYIAVCWCCVFCFFPPWSDDHITSSAYSGTRNRSIYASLHTSYKSAICLIFQKDRLHSADATTIPVGSFRRALWMFCARHIWLPTMYQCAVCAHLCQGLRSLGCGWLWDECSPLLLGSRKPSRCRSSRMYPAICGLEWWVRVYLYDAAENPLSFDVATTVGLRFAKLKLISLNSHTWSAYLPRIMIHYSVCTNLSARN